MEQWQIKEQVEELNSLFNISPCQVKFVENISYGRDAVYYPAYHRIELSNRYLERITPSVVMHEFAHHLNHIRRTTQKQLKQSRNAVKHYEKALRGWDFGYAEQQKETRALALGCKRLPTKRQIHHGDDFVRCLKQIIYKTGIDYDTSREYITVTKKLGKVGKQEAI